MLLEIFREFQTVFVIMDSLARARIYNFEKQC